MKIILSIAVLLRSPLKTLLTFILLSAAAFMLVYSASDYALLHQEYDKAVARYHGHVSAEYGPARMPAYSVVPFFCFRTKVTKRITIILLSMRITIKWGYYHRL